MAIDLCIGYYTTTPPIHDNKNKDLTPEGVVVWIVILLDSGKIVPTPEVFKGQEITPLALFYSADELPQKSKMLSLLIPTQPSVSGFLQTSYTHAK